MKPTRRDRERTRIKESLSADRWVRVIILAAGYTLTGIVGLSLAIPPGYATPVWPPSGIALAGVLMWGPRVWPGIVAGAFLVNMAVALTTAEPGLTWLGGLIAASIAAGSTVQIMVAAGALRRWVGVAQLFESGPAMLAFTGVSAGACLIASTWGVATLNVAGGPGSITHLSANSKVTRQAISKHLDVLADVGLVRSTWRGRERVWDLAPERLSDAHEYLNRISRMWDQAIDRLRAFVEAEEE